MNNANTFSKFSIVLGVCSLILASSVMFGVVTGGMAIIFAVLSKGKELKMEKTSKIGMYVGLVGMLASIAVAANTVYMYKTDARYRKEINDEFEKAYGKTINEYIDDLYNSYMGE